MQRFAYIFSEDGAETSNPYYSGTAEFVHEKSFAGEHGFAEPLVLHLFHYTLSSRHEGISSYIPLLAACEAEGCDITEERRCE